MDPAGLRLFARRDWAAAATAKLDYWAERYRSDGPAAARQAATQLWQHARAVQPEYPTAADRGRDLADHLELCERLDRAARALAVRPTPAA